MPAGCNIKGKYAVRARVTGNLGIYHLQACRSYPGLSKPDRWFCSEEDAQAAGFRRAYNCRSPPRANEAGKTAASCVKVPARLPARMTTSDTSNVLPETAAAERLRRHLQEIANERDRAHRAVQEREAELARIQRIAGVGGLEIDFRDGVKNRRSPEYLLVHGLPPEAANESYEEWVSRIHPDDRERTVQHLFDVLKSESEDYSAEYRIVRPNDGTTRWIRVVAKIERDRDGRALRLVGADLDVTAQMLAQATLRESEERFRLIANSAPVPIWVTKLDRTRSFANQAYLDFLGLPFEEAIAFDWRNCCIRTTSLGSCRN